MTQTQHPATPATPPTASSTDRHPASARREALPNLEATLNAATDWLLDDQHPEGYWVGQLESNVCMEAEWVMAMHVLGVPREHPTMAKLDGVVAGMLAAQRDDGSWRVYHDAPAGDINCTVEAYIALRIAGLDPDSEPLAKARDWVLNYPGNRGDHSGRRGLASVRNFTKYWMALLGEWPWEHTPQLPPEIIYAPRWFPFCVYRFASWARATILPLAILSTRRFSVPLDGGRRLDELFPTEQGGRGGFDFSLARPAGMKGIKRVCSWAGLFFGADAVLHRYLDFPWHPGRETAVASCLDWIIRHQEADGAWSGIQPPWVYALMALRCEGYALDHPVLAAGIGAFDLHWKVERGRAIEGARGGSGGGENEKVGLGPGAGDASALPSQPPHHASTRVYLQASESPIWDTVLAALALLDCGHDVRHSPALERAVGWLLDEQILVEGDWKVYVPEARPGGWAFEFENDLYPDVDDTAVALIVLARVRRQLADLNAEAAKNGDARLYGLKRRVEAAIDAGVPWMLAMQCKNGGWAAFDKDNDTQLLTKIPFADFGELLDPPSVDVTAHVVEAMAELGYRRDHPALVRALAYMRSEQEHDGPWFGRWGVNYIYGTAAVLPALHAIGEDMRQPYIRRAADWLVGVQQGGDGGRTGEPATGVSVSGGSVSGGWGESCASYMDPAQRGRGPATASQTAWAIMALAAMHPDPARDEDRPYLDAIERGVAYLAATQLDDTHRPDIHTRPSRHSDDVHGTWHEPQYTGTGFPGYGVGERIEALATANDLDPDLALQRAFMINYNLYRHYFPLMALGRVRTLWAGG